jgi:hypothetical protein
MKYCDSAVVGRILNQIKHVERDFNLTSVNLNWCFLINEEIGVNTSAKGGADAQLGEKQLMWRHLLPERASTSFQMRHSQGMTCPKGYTQVIDSNAYFTVFNPRPNI